MQKEDKALAIQDDKDELAPEKLIENMFNSKDDITSDNVKVLLSLIESDKNLKLKTDLSSKDIQRLRLQLLWAELVKPIDPFCSRIAIIDAINFMELRISLKRESRKEMIKGISTEISDTLKRNTIDKFIH